jgi:cell division protein FtsA
MPKTTNFLVGLDLGTSETRCVVGVEEQGRIRYLTYGAARSSGWKKGVIVDQDPVVQSIEQAVAEAEANGGISIDSAVVGVGATVASAASRGAVNLVPRTDGIEPADVNEAVKAATRAQLGDDRMLLQAIPLEFIVDSQEGIRNPLGMIGRRLEAQVQLLTTSTQAHVNVTTVVNRAGIVVEETIFEPFAGALAAIHEQERQIGVMVCDVGAGSTDLVIYLEDQLRAAVSIPIGGDRFVRDVSFGLKTTESDAGRIVEQYGCAVAAMTAANSVIEVPSAGDRTLREAPRRALNDILESRAEELFVYVKKELERARVGGPLIAGLVLIGGVAKMTGLADVAEQVLHTSVRIGLPAPLYELPDALDQPEWTAAIGLLLYAQRLRLHRQAERESMSAWLRNIFRS